MNLICLDIVIVFNFANFVLVCNLELSDMHFLVVLTDKLVSAIYVFEKLYCHLCGCTIIRS